MTLRKRIQRRARRRNPRYSTFVEVVRFVATTGATTIVSSNEMQILGEIRRPYRVVSATAQALVTQPSASAAGLQVRLLDGQSAGAKGVASSPHTLVGFNPRSVTVRQPPGFDMLTPDSTHQLVAVDAMCYGTAVKIAVMLNITIQFQRMESAVDACVTAREVHPVFGFGPFPNSEPSPESASASSVSDVDFERIT